MILAEYVSPFTEYFREGSLFHCGRHGEILLCHVADLVASDVSVCVLVRTVCVLEFESCVVLVHNYSGHVSASVWQYRSVPSVWAGSVGVHIHRVAVYVTQQHGEFRTFLSLKDLGERLVERGERTLAHWKLTVLKCHECEDVVVCECPDSPGLLRNVCLRASCLLKDHSVVHSCQRMEHRVLFSICHDRSVKHGLGQTQLYPVSLAEDVILLR